MLLLTYQALEDQKAKVAKLRALDIAIQKTYEDKSDKAALRRALLQQQKEAIRSTFPKPTLVKHD